MQRCWQNTAVSTTNRRLSHRRRLLLPGKSHNSCWVPANYVKYPFSSWQQRPPMFLAGFRRQCSQTATTIRHFTATSSEDSHRKIITTDVPTSMVAVETEQLSDSDDQDDDSDNDHENDDDRDNASDKDDDNDIDNIDIDNDIEDELFDDILGEQDDDMEGGLSSEYQAGGETRLIFREKLNNWYRANFDVSLNDAFIATSVTADDKESMKMPDHPWTSTFICPITNHKIPAKSLPGIHNNNNGYFSSKKLANQAAAMEALHFFCPMEESSTKSYSQKDGLGKLARKRLQLHYMKEHNVVLTDEVVKFTLTTRPGKKQGGSWWTASFICPVTEEVFPAMKLSVYENSTLDDGRIWYRRKGEASQAAFEKALWAKETGTAGLSKDEYDAYANIPSFEPLRLWYQKNHDLSLTKEDNFVVTAENWKGSGGNLWTATFICPVSGNRYDSGSLMRLEPLPVSKEGGIQWYRKKNDAIAAAALRAYDTLAYNASGKNNPRFCREDPSGKNEPGAQENVVMMDENNEMLIEQVDENTYFTVENENIRDNDVAYDDGVGGDDGDQNDDDDDDDNYIVEFVPQRLGETFGGATAPSTLDLVMETWIHSSQLGNKTPSTGSTQPFLWASDTPQKMREEAVQRALAWVTHQQPDACNRDRERIRFDNIAIASSRTIAKMLLQNLARANRAFSDNKGQSGIEEAAKSIIDFLVSSPATFPDADCLALYIQCLEGRRHNVARKAERIFNAMSTGDHLHGHVMPPPNTSVFNSLVQRRAEAGILTNLSELERVAVDKETFLSCLSAIAFATGQGGSSFDAQYVMDCIQEMKLRSLEADIAVYNAPMRWNASVAEALISRPYTRPIAWDGLDTLFESKWDIQDSFNDQEPRVREAQAIENWFRSIDAQAFGPGVRPNIETYESVIQAWVRTHPSEGLDHAEEILDLLYSVQNDELKIRPQTVHPFLAASAHAGDFARVDRWIQKLREREGQTFFDSRLRAAPILARVVGKEATTAMAEECLLLLNEAIEETRKDAGIMVDAKTFAMVIETFHKQGKENRSAENISSDSFFGVQQTLDMFDEFMASLLDSSESDRLIQHHHLMHYAPLVYSSTFSALRGLRSDGDATLPDHLKWLERILRRSGELCLLSEKRQGRPPDVGVGNGPLVHTDGFSYNFERVLRGKDQISWREYYSLVIDGISEMYQRQEERSNESELQRLLILVSKLQRTGNNIHGAAASFANTTDQIDFEQTSHMKSEFEHSLSSEISADGKKDKFSPTKSGPSSKESVRLDYENRRRKRTEKHTKRPPQRPRKASAEKRRLAQTA